ncbi:hypothetical protein BO71DRAFT_33026 [Aspergillus ellipticus CBS 707.79]|uniref:Uncharacterized protein n=1 Tax=Aspergillus ellipticus CBS 707.79 TaxID=1448320 RepID=A0A319DPZ6_9EURO|nr:hypothetical protein BO71DRAFT_33026 [Aspergillus ellipticus CBS 707.79]
MKYTTTVIPAILLLIPTHAFPQPPPGPTPAWQISLYQNKRCTGETTFFYGNATLPCHDAILNGGALGYIVEINNRSNCTVQFSDDTSCNRTIGVVGAGAGLTGCRAPDVQGVEGADAQIRRFSVNC